MKVLEKDPQALKEMSMVDLFHSILKEKQEPLPFEDLCAEIMKAKGWQIFNTSYKARLFTEVNIDGRFKPVGDQQWGLRTWYPVDHSEEPVITQTRKKKKPLQKKEEELEGDWPEEVTEDEEFIDRDLVEDEEIDADIDELEELDGEMVELDEEPEPQEDVKNELEGVEEGNER